MDDRKDPRDLDFYLGAATFAVWALLLILAADTGSSTMGLAVRGLLAGLLVVAAAYWLKIGRDVARSERATRAPVADAYPVRDVEPDRRRRAA